MAEPIEFFKAQLQLCDLLVQLLRFSAEPHLLDIEDEQFRVLDLDIAKSRWSCCSGLTRAMLSTLFRARSVVCGTAISCTYWTSALAMQNIPVCFNCLSMRGTDDQLQSGMFSYVSLEDRIPATHPLRGVRKLADAVLAEMSKEFDGMYAKVGRPSIPPERLFRALLLQVFYSVRSERC